MEWHQLCSLSNEELWHNGEFQVECRFGTIEWRQLCSLPNEKGWHNGESQIRGRFAATGSSPLHFYRSETVSIGTVRDFARKLFRVCCDNVLIY
jgi:hypothetical protein